MKKISKMLSEDAVTKILTYNRFIYSQRLFLSLIIGFLAGLSMGYFLVITSDPNYQYYLYRKSMQIEDEMAFSSYNIIEHVHEEENTTFAEILYDKVKVLCWITTKPRNHLTLAKYIKETWGKRCNKLIFISSEDDEELGAIAVTPKVNEFWGITISALQYIYENYIDEYDWFLRADEDTYVILENLRYMLSSHSSDIPISFGSKHQNPELVYNTAGSGYVLSREVIKLFNEKVLPSPKDGCNIEGYGNEDFELAKCLKTIDVIIGDSRDSDGRTKFHSLAIEDHLLTLYDNPKDWFFDSIYYKTGSGIEYTSDYAVSFDYVAPGFMFTLEYLIYHLRPYGIWSFPEDLPVEKYTIEDELRILEESEKDRMILKQRK